MNDALRRGNDVHEYIAYLFSRNTHKKEQNMPAYNSPLPNPLAPFGATGIDNCAMAPEAPPEMSMNQGKHFFVIWNPHSPKPPRVRFSSLKEAQKVAEDMAQRHGEPFYVMKAVSLAQRSAPPVETKKLK